MLWILFSLMLILWLFGMLSGQTMGGLIHVLLVVAIAVFLIHLIRGGRSAV